MRLSRVTVTGADNNTDPKHLIELSKEYPFVEWGILFSKKRINESRYPFKYYGYTLKSLASAHGVDVKLAAHICGNWTREFFLGDFSFKNYFGEISYFDIFKRVQLNFNSTNSPYDLDKVLKIVGSHFFTNFIFQHNHSNLNLCNKIIGKLDNIQFLYDSSGGRGTSRNEWTYPIKGHFTGYAGGLNPTNLEHHLELINSVTEPTEKIWIDVETGVRNNQDELDLQKVKDFLMIASKYAKK